MGGLSAGTRVAIEQAIARGRSDEQIVAELGVEPRVARLVRAYLEAINDENELVSARTAKRRLDEGLARECEVCGEPAFEDLDVCYDCDQRAYKDEEQYSFFKADQRPWND